LRRNPGAIPVNRFPSKLGVTAAAVIHSGLAGVERAVWGRRIERTKVDPPPLFILGHWRCGTTHLHELLVRDPRHTFPNTYECFDPNHFLLTEGSTDKLLAFVLPDRRPMDNMAVGFGRPQEDEFALCGLGLPSPYLSIAFPKQAPQNPEYLDFSGVPRADVEKWKNGLVRFLKRVQIKRPGRMILKSPAHTSRIPVLLDAFPNALFVHIVRNPYDVYPSTIHLWKSLQKTWALQGLDCPWLEDWVVESFVKMYEVLEKTRSLVPPERFFELTYECLEADPMGSMRRLYEHLGLGGFDAVRPTLEAYLAGLKGYRKNEYKVTKAQEDIVTRRWGHVVKRYGYELRGTGGRVSSADVDAATS